MGVLYVLRRPDDETALSALRQAHRDGATRTEEVGVASPPSGPPAVLLLQDAVYLDAVPGTDARVFYSREDAEARGAAPAGQALDWMEIVDLLFQFDRVLGW